MKFPFLRSLSLTVFFTFLLTCCCWSLTTAQLTTIKADIQASQDLSGFPNDEPGCAQIAALYNAAASTDFWVLKTSITEEDIVGQPGPDATQFSWTIFINRSQGERDGWMRLFRSGKINPSFSNVNQAVTDIFSGAGGLSNRTHIFACFRRKSTRLEKLLATTDGSNYLGTTAKPALLVFEGNVTLTDILQARNL